MVPLVIELEDVTESPLPSGYLVTVVIGALMVQGVRFTAEELYVDLTTELELPRIWPTQGTLTWLTDRRMDDETFEPMLQGKALRVLDPGIRLVPFKPATDLPPSDIEGTMFRQPVPCGKHFIYYPGILALEAIHQGKRYAFLTRCECDIAYLVLLEADGTHFRNDGPMEQMIEVIDRIEGEMYEMNDENGYFCFKELV